MLSPLSGASSANWTSFTRSCNQYPGSHLEFWPILRFFMNILSSFSDYWITESRASYPDWDSPDPVSSGKYLIRTRLTRKIWAWSDLINYTPIILHKKVSYIGSGSYQNIRTRPISSFSMIFVPKLKHKCCNLISAYKCVTQDWLTDWLTGLPEARGRLAEWTVRGLGAGRRKSTCCRRGRPASTCQPRRNTGSSGRTSRAIIGAST